MSENYQLKIPTIANFEAEYYFSNKPVPYEAKVYPPHLHDGVEFYILLDGDVSFMVESTLYKLSPGDVIVTKPNEMHNCVLNSRSVHRHLCFWFDASCEFLFSDFTAHEFGKNNLISPNDEIKKRLYALYEELEKASREKDVHQKFRLTLELLTLLRQDVSDRETYHPLPETLQRILADINSNFTKIKDLSYFTEKYFISQSTLNRLFKSRLHTTPKLYLETKQLAYSRRLLKEGESVLSACIKSGFSDCSNYIRLFKKRFSITPNEYKNT